MSYLIVSDTALKKVAAPNLPLAPRNYDRRYVDQLNNVLRLYFNQLDNQLSQLKISGASDSIQTQLWLGNSGGLFSG